MNKVILLVLLFISCNPVKQVLSDRKKFDEVAKEVIKAGYCANDTTIIVKSDTLINIDTVSVIDHQLQIEVMNDTTYITKYRTNTITKTLRIHDTIKSIIVDNARVQLLLNDLNKSNAEKEVYKERFHKTFGWLLILILSIGAYIFLKFKK